MFLKLKRISTFLLLLGLVLLFLQSCRSKDESKTSEKSSRSVITSTLTEISPEDITFEELFQTVDTNVYYVGKVVSSEKEEDWSEEFVLSVTHLEKKKFSCKVCDVSNIKQCVVTPFDMNGIIKKNRCTISIDGKNMVIKKIRLAKTNSIIQGDFLIDKKNYVVTMTKYETQAFREHKNRYADSLFSIKVIKDVKFGEAMGYWTSKVVGKANYLNVIAKGLSESAKQKKLNLLMDVYLPENDDMKYRPLIMFIHGGAFYVGDKAEAPLVKWCEYFASRGYVVASINYRMGFHFNRKSIERCGYCALQDAHAAMRFLVSKNEEYGIDPNYIFVSGSSAGSITALNLTFMREDTRPASTYAYGSHKDLGCIATSGNDIERTFRIRAISNMWGAVPDLDLLNAAKTDIISFHGDADRLVPYDSGIPFSDLKVKIGGILFGKLYGSASIHRKAKQLGYRSEFYTFQGAGHAPQIDKKGNLTKEFYFIQEHLADFLYQEFVPEIFSISHKGGSSQWFSLPKADYEDISWRVDGGFILETKENSARVVFISGEKSSLNASVLFKNGAAQVVSYSQN